MEPINLNAASQPQSRLLSLPAEIQIMIFDRAYIRLADGKHVDKSLWRERERARKDSATATSAYVRRLFPEPKVSELLVSKQFFDLAARSYVGTEPVDSRKAYFKFMAPDNIFWRFARGVIIGPHELPQSRGPRMSEYVVRMSRYHFGACLAKVRDVGHEGLSSDDELCADEDWAVNKRLTRSDFSKLQVFTDAFKRARDVAALRLISDDKYHGRMSPQQTVIWLTNLKAYDEFVRSLRMSSAPGALCTPESTHRPSPSTSFVRAPIDPRAGPSLGDTPTPGSSSIPTSPSVKLRSAIQATSTTVHPRMDRHFSRKRARSVTSEEAAQAMPKRRKQIPSTARLSLRLDSISPPSGRAQEQERTRQHNTLPTSTELQPLCSTREPTSYQAPSETLLSIMLSGLEPLVAARNPVVMAWLEKIKTQNDF